MEHLTLAAAQRIALAAQGFSRRQRLPTKQAAYASLARTGVWQVDSVNVFARSHLMPWFSRNGAYDLTLFNEIAWGKRTQLVEYTAHEATLLPQTWLPKFQWRMDDMRARYLAEGTWLASQPALQQQLIAELRDRGPLTAAELDNDPAVKATPWWGWTDVKRALELMFRTGDVTSVERRGFRRVYALPEQVLPDEVRHGLPREQAQYELVRHAVRALGIGTTSDVADYYRMHNAATRLALRRLEDEGHVAPVTVSNWTEPTWIATGATRSTRTFRDALLSPFDPLVWCRPRLKRLWNMDYRIEIYTPAPKRVYGYYSLPVLVDGKIAGRVDLKADRAGHRLLVNAAWAEPGERLEAIAPRVMALLSQAAQWQDLDTIVIAPMGNLAESLRASPQH